MNTVEKIETLISENELLKLQLDDLYIVVGKKDREISFLGDETESAASLQSRIDGNLAEIEQLKYQISAGEQKAAGAEIMNEELEATLLKEIRDKHRREAEIKSLGSVRTELGIISGELDETIPLYTRVQNLEAELAAANSMLSLFESENIELKHEIAEMRELLAELKKKKFD